MKIKQLFEKQINDYAPINPIIDFSSIEETSIGKTIQWILNNFNHLYVEYSESKAITRNNVPAIIRRKGLWITYVIENEVITEYYIGDNVNVQNYADWTSDDNWKLVSNK